MTDMIEKMARASYASWRARQGNIIRPWEQLPDDTRAGWLKDTTAALSALEEPSEEMVRTAQEAEWPDIPSETHREMLRKRLKRQWCAMIKAAKGEE